MTRLVLAWSLLLVSACADGRVCASSRDCSAREICLITDAGRTCHPSPPSKALPLADAPPSDEPLRRDEGDAPDAPVIVDEPAPTPDAASPPRVRAGAFTSGTRTLRGGGYTLTFGPRPVPRNPSRRNP